MENKSKKWVAETEVVPKKKATKRRDALMLRGKDNTNVSRFRLVTIQPSIIQKLFYLFTNLLICITLPVKWHCLHRWDTALWGKASRLIYTGSNHCHVGAFWLEIRMEFWPIQIKTLAKDVLWLKVSSQFNLTDVYWMVKSCFPFFHWLLLNLMVLWLMMWNDDEEGFINDTCKDTSS